MSTSLITSSSFIYGGSDLQQDQLFTSDFAAVFILSLPAFRWLRIPNSTVQRRQSHNCQVIGGRQMLVIGGTNTQASTADVWTNGLGIFDMTALEWTSMYNASAEPYVQPEPVKQYYMHG